jgi:hypothetical protein
MIFAASSLSHSFRNSLGYITRPAFVDIESHHARRVGILAIHNFADDGPFIGLCLISFDVSTAKFAKIVEYDINGDVVG